MPDASNVEIKHGGAADCNAKCRDVYCSYAGKRVKHHPWHEDQQTNDHDAAQVTHVIKCFVPQENFRCKELRYPARTRNQQHLHRCFGSSHAWKKIAQGNAEQRSEGYRDEQCNQDVCDPVAYHLIREAVAQESTLRRRDNIPVVCKGSVKEGKQPKKQPGPQEKIHEPVLAGKNKGYSLRSVNRFTALSVDQRHPISEPSCVNLVALARWQRPVGNHLRLRNGSYLQDHIA